MKIVENKSRFYATCLGHKLVQRIIFSVGRTLRQDVTLLGSSQIKMIFGPCSGLLHCASAIWNFYRKVHGAKINPPNITVYTGLYGKENYNINQWWGAAPLVDAIFIIKEKGIPEIKTLLKLPFQERDNIPRESCDFYTSELLLNYFSELQIV